jgi:1-acyl-sn-glycerol-3-phosphate acyltransferase
MIFPEGTRSRDGSLLPFKAGAFQLALETGAKVLPLALAGTRRCRPKGSFGFGEARAIAKVLAPIDPAAFTGPHALEDLRDATRAVIVENVQALERRLGFSPVPPHPQDELRRDTSAAAE